MRQNSVRASLLPAGRRVCRQVGMVAILIVGTSAVASAATTITEWTFENDAIATNNTPVADKGTGTADSIGMNVYATPNVGVTQDDVLVGVTSGKNSDTGANGESDGSQEWRIRGQAGTNGAANGWSSQAPIGQGAQYFFSTAGYNSISVQFDWYATTQGEAHLQLEYTTNGGSTWTNVPINIGTNSTRVWPL